jgi:hypothetical protein
MNASVPSLGIRVWQGYDTFVLTQQVEQVYYMSYPCEKLSAWWVVHKVNPC